MANPMCCIPLAKGTPILAFIQIGLSILCLVQNAFTLSSYLPNAMEEYRAKASNADKVPRVYSMKVAITLLSTTYWTCCLLAGILLYTATKQRDLRKCRQWFVAACLLSILFIVDLMMQAFSMRATTLEILAPLAATLILFYMILVVLVYMDEVRLGGCEQIKSQTEIPT